MKIDDILQIPADTLLAEELAGDDVVEMANLTTAQTRTRYWLCHGNAQSIEGGQGLIRSHVAAQACPGSRPHD